MSASKRSWWSYLNPWSNRTSTALVKAPERKPLGVNQRLHMSMMEFKLRPQDILPRSQDGRALFPLWDSNTAIRRALLASSWVYACITRVARQVSKLPMKAQQFEGMLNGQEVWTEVGPDHPLQDLLNTPHMFFSMSSLIERIIYELYLTGNSLVCKIRVDGIPVELFTVRPHDIAPVPSTTVFIKEYEVRNEIGELFIVPADDIIHLMFVNPDNQYWGLSPIQAAGRAIDTDIEAANWQFQSLKNMMIPPLAFMFKGHFTKDQYDDAKKWLQDQWMGAANARHPIILGGQDGVEEISIEKLGFSPQEVDFMGTRQWTKKEVCAVIGYPSLLLDPQDATFANLEGARELLWEETLMPLVNLIEDGLTLRLAPEFANGRQLRVRADTSKVDALLAPIKRRLVIIKDMWDMGTPFNQAAERVNLNMRIPGGDVGFLPANLFQVETEGSSHLPECPDEKAFMKRPKTH